MIKDKNEKFKTILICLLLMLIYFPSKFIKNGSGDFTAILINRLIPMVFGILFSIYFGKRRKIGERIIHLNMISKKRFFESMAIFLGGYGFTYLSYNIVKYIAKFHSQFAPLARPYANILQLNNTSFIFAIIINALLLSISDELIFRGVILGYMRKNFSPVFAVIFQSVIYGLMQNDLIYGLYCFVLGISFSLAYLKTESIYIPILGHFLINFFAISGNYFNIHMTNKILGIVGVIMMIPAIKILSEWIQQLKLWAVKVNIDNSKENNMEDNMFKDPIGVFDSGVGGLTVLKELYNLMPNENYIYLGDTLRLPYGTKTDEEVESFCVDAYRFFKSKGAKAMVIACNTATAAGLEKLEEIADIPVIGVIEPGAKEAVEKRAKNIGIIATDGTVKSHVYQSYLKKLMPDVIISEVGCPDLVIAVEKGNAKNEIGREITYKYLDKLDENVETIILGCTHFPAVNEHIIKYYRDKDREINIANPAVKTAQMLQKEILEELNRSKEKGNISFNATSDKNAFKEAGNSILDGAIEIEDVKIVDLKDY